MNPTGQAGLNSSASSFGSSNQLLTMNTFVTFSDTIPAIEIAANWQICAVFLNNRVRCFGNNNVGELGDGTFISRGTVTSSVTTATFVTFAATINTIPVKSVAAGGYITNYYFHTCINE